MPVPVPVSVPVSEPVQASRAAAAAEYVPGILHYYTGVLDERSWVNRSTADSRYEMEVHI